MAFTCAVCADLYFVLLPVYVMLGGGEESGGGF